VLVAVTSLLALILLQPRDLTNFGWALLFQGFYLQNLAFWNIGDYFEWAFAKPLLHTWSLAVEEQFYLFFPLFILFVRRSGKWKTPLLIAAIVASLAVGWMMAQISPKTSFYWLPTRVWEFAVGILAAKIYQSRPIGRSLSAILVIAGTVAILCAVFLFDAQSHMPSLQTVLAVFGTAAVLLGQDAGPTRIYETKLSQHFGRMSYSWYLWHWPPLSFYAIVAGTSPSLPIAVLLGLAGYGLGYLSYLYLERGYSKQPWTGRTAFSLIAVFCLCTFVMGLTILQRHGFVRDYPVQTQALLAAQMDVPPYRCPLIKRVQMWRSSVCQISGGPGQRTLLVGDSHADRYKTVLASSPLFITKQNCTAIDYGMRPDCNWPALLADIDQLGVQRVIFVSHWAPSYQPADYARLKANLAQVKVDMVLLLPTPEGPQFDPATYLPKGSFPEFVPIAGQDVASRTAEFRGALKAIASENPRLRLVDALPILCPDRCRFAVGPTPIYLDSHHLTLKGVELVAPALQSPSAR